MAATGQSGRSGRSGRSGGSGQSSGQSPGQSAGQSPGQSEWGKRVAGGLASGIGRGLERLSQKREQLAHARDVAIDLGTANSLVVLGGSTKIRSEPSIVAVRRGKAGSREIVAVGGEAKRMLGRTPTSIETVRPLRDGVIADFDMAEALLRHLIESVRTGYSLIRPRVVVAVPVGITQVEQRAVRDAATAAGARKVHLLQEPMAAAIGSGIDVLEPNGNLIVDIGGGTTDIAVISLGGIVCARSLRLGGDAMDAAIQNYIRRKLDLVIGEATAERIKLEVGSATADGVPRTMVVKGNDAVRRAPRAVEVSSDDVREALAEIVAAIVRGTHETLERTPPEVSSDLADRGLVLTGGGAFIAGLDRALEIETGIPVHRAPDPLNAVVSGCHRCLHDLDLLQQVEMTRGTED